MADKHFKIKNNLVVSDLTIAGPIIRHTDGTLTSHTALPIDKGGTGQTTASNALNSLLPAQVDHANKFLQTDGVNTSWIIPNYSEIAVDGVIINARKTLNLIGFTVEDDPANNRTNVVLSGATALAVALEP